MFPDNKLGSTFAGIHTTSRSLIVSEGSDHETKDLLSCPAVSDEVLFGPPMVACPSECGSDLDIEDTFCLGTDLGQSITENSYTQLGIGYRSAHGLSDGLTCTSPAGSSYWLCVHSNRLDDSHGKELFQSK